MMTDTIHYEKNVPVRYVMNVCVVGGGPAGIAAAVTCARQGKEVLLIEQTGVFGGTSCIAMVPEIMNFDDGVHFLAGGFGEELHHALFGSCRFQREWKNTRPEELKRYYDAVLRSSGVHLLLYTRLTDVILSDGTVTHLILSAPDGVFAVSADYFIDGTGNGSLCSLAGVPHQYGDAEGTAMPATLCSLWGGIDFANKETDGKHLQKAYDAGLFSQYDTVLPGIKANYPEVSVGGGNVGHVFRVDDRSAEALTEAMLCGRKVLAEFEQYYRTYVGGCEQAVLLKTADFLGIRESRRVLCETTLTIEHFSDGYVYEDEIGRYSYPIDIHPMTPDAEGMKNFGKSVSIRHENGQSYGIPYRCLVPVGVHNLFVAGRCIGAEHEMQASVRVIPGCYITGQAAGIAAAVCCEQKTSAKDADVREIQNRLAAVGAYL